MSSVLIQVVMDQRLEEDQVDKAIPAIQASRLNKGPVQAQTTTHIQLN